MVLNWLYQGDVVDGSTFRPPKNLGMVAANVTNTPEHFRVYQVFSPASQALRRLLERPARRFVSTVPAQRGRGGTYTAAREWRLPTPTGYHFASRFRFQGADPYEESGLIRSHRLGDIGFTGNAGARLHDPTGGVPIGTNGNGALTADFRAAVDPILIVQVLAGAELFRTVIQDTLEDVYAEGVDTQTRDFEAKLNAAIDVMSPSFVYPDDWFHGTSPSKFTAEEGSVTQIDLGISANSVGEGLVALQVIDGDNPDVGAISDILRVSASGGGRIRATTAIGFGRPEERVS